MELDLQRLFGLHVHSCIHKLRPRNSRTVHEEENAKNTLMHIAIPKDLPCRNAPLKTIVESRECYYYYCLSTSIFSSPLSHFPRGILCFSNLETF
jgi:hypothetical protein